MLTEDFSVRSNHPIIEFNLRLDTSIRSNLWEVVVSQSISTSSAIQHLSTTPSGILHHNSMGSTSLLWISLTIDLRHRRRLHSTLNHLRPYFTDRRNRAWSITCNLFLSKIGRASCRERV